MVILPYIRMEQYGDDYHQLRARKIQIIEWKNYDLLNSHIWVFGLLIETATLFVGFYFMVYSL